MYRRTLLSVFAATALALAVTDCDFSPTAPFSGFGGEQGATLNGRFQQTSAASTAQIASASAYRTQTTLASEVEVDALTVIVRDSENNEIGSVDIKDGAFTLRGLPDAFSLAFVDENGDPVGRPMDFDGVKPNQEIDILVAIEDGSVVLLEEKRTGINHEGSSGVELEGRAHNIAIDSIDDPMTGSLYVDGQRVLTRAYETSIRKGNRNLTLENLNENDRVHVRGVWEDEDVFAFEIKLQEEEDEEEETSQEACDISDPRVRDPDKPNHILVCHNGRTLSIAPDAWPGHRGHGDTCGPCT